MAIAAVHAMMATLGSLLSIGPTSSESRSGEPMRAIMSIALRCTLTAICLLNSVSLVRPRA